MVSSGYHWCVCVCVCVCARLPSGPDRPDRAGESRDPDQARERLPLCSAVLHHQLVQRGNRTPVCRIHLVSLYVCVCVLFILVGLPMVSLLVRWCVFVCGALQVVNAFCRQTDPESKLRVVTRIQNITHLQSLLERALAGRTQPLLFPRSGRSLYEAALLCFSDSWLHTTSCQLRWGDHRRGAGLWLSRPAQEGKER